MYGNFAEISRFHSRILPFIYFSQKNREIKYSGFFCRDEQLCVSYNINASLQT